MREKKKDLERPYDELGDLLENRTESIIREFLDSVQASLEESDDEEYKGQQLEA